MNELTENEVFWSNAISIGCDFSSIKEKIPGEGNMYDFIGVCDKDCVVSPRGYRDSPSIMVTLGLDVDSSDTKWERTYTHFRRVQTTQDLPSFDTRLSSFPAFLLSRFL